MSHIELTIFEKFTALAIARKGIRNNLPRDLIKAKIKQKLSKIISIEDLENIYNQALKKETVLITQDNFN